jgi:hypothetical protein
MSEVGFEQRAKINALVPKTYSEAQDSHAPFSQSTSDKTPECCLVVLEDFPNLEYIY